ncbi:MAG: TetR family transcriptional regulator [Candidatus Microthrix parvicella]|jgi:AcrR family transcriptional regulator|nr:TetR family transcriptional regulator [Candidatus Microthrix sp.]MBP7853203.1 TetR family transcriptional regulator [Candidatus Microthrix sp.]
MGTDSSSQTGPRTDGKTRLLDAAEALLDQAGIDGTTGAAITAAAGHKNAAAVNYHFGNLDRLIRAVLDRRATELNVIRHARLDELEAGGSVEPRAAFVAIVEPLADLLASKEGRRYLRLLNQAANHPRFHAQAGMGFASSLERGAANLSPLVSHLAPDRQRHRAGNVLGLVLFALAEQARVIDDEAQDMPVLGCEAFIVDLADSSLAALSA